MPGNTVVQGDLCELQTGNPPCLKRALREAPARSAASGERERQERASPLHEEPLPQTQQGARLSLWASVGSGEQLELAQRGSKPTGFLRGTRFLTCCDPFSSTAVFWMMLSMVWRGCVCLLARTVPSACVAAQACSVVHVNIGLSSRAAVFTCK